MSGIIDYIKTCFCKHDYLIDTGVAEIEGIFENKSGLRVSCTCKKCGYHKSFWKYI